MMNDIILSVEDATALGIDALRAIGFDDEQAPVITAHLVDAALCGYRFAGLPRILTISEDPRTYAPRSPMKVVHETEVSALIDGGNNIGYYAVYRATQLAIEKAMKSRIALVGMYRSALSGRNLYYVEAMARAGLVGIHIASSAPMVLPHGGAKPAFGTNPLAFGFPTDGNPFIVDLGTAAMNRGEVILRTRTGEPLPEGTAVDADGVPTTDPVEALKGGIFSFGGHRGSALAFGIQALCRLAGSARPAGREKDWGFMFLAFDPEILMPRAEFAAALAELIASGPARRRWTRRSRCAFRPNARSGSARSGAGPASRSHPRCTRSSWSLRAKHVEGKSNKGTRRRDEIARETTADEAC